MIEDIFSLYYLALALAGVVAILWIIFEASEKKPAGRKEKTRMYTSGTGISPQDLNIQEPNYYEYMKRFLRAESLARLHSGDLSTYMAWILIGMALIFSVMLIAW